MKVVIDNGNGDKSLAEALDRIQKKFIGQPNTEEVQRELKEEFERLADKFQRSLNSVEYIELTITIPKID